MFQLHLTVLNSSLKTSHFDSDGDFNRFMRHIYRKHGLPRFLLKQPSTEYVILRSVDDIEFHMFSLTQKYVQSCPDYTSVEIHGFPV